MGCFFPLPLAGMCANFGDLLRPFLLPLPPGEGGGEGSPIPFSMVASRFPHPHPSPLPPAGEGKRRMLLQVSAYAPMKEGASPQAIRQFA